jgi:hypothetical protein
MFAAVHESGSGTFETSCDVRDPVAMGRAARQSASQQAASPTPKTTSFCVRLSRLKPVMRLRGPLKTTRICKFRNHQYHVRQADARNVTGQLAFLNGVDGD